MITLPDLWNPGVCGRMGNQIFELAAAYAHSLRTGHELVVPECQIGTRIKGPMKMVPREQLPRPTVVHHEPSLTYSPLPALRDGDVLAMHGYFASHRYWAEVEDAVWDFFYPGDELYDDAKRSYRELADDETVALCVRRGDYVEKQHFHPLQPHSYYERAAEMFPDAKTFLVFSDDIPWCEANLQLPRLKFCREHYDWKALWMMSFCDHHIIANSTYH